MRSPGCSTRSRRRPEAVRTDPGRRVLRREAARSAARWVARSAARAVWGRVRSRLHQVAEDALEVVVERRDLPELGFAEEGDAAQPYENWIETRYEAKARREGRGSSYLRFQRTGV